MGVKALGKDIINYLVTEWFQPKCCLSVLTDTPEKDSDATDKEKEDTDATNEKNKATNITLANEEKATNTNETSEEKEVIGPSPDETPTNQTKPPSAAASILMSWRAMGSAASFGVAITVWSLLV